MADIEEVIKGLELCSQGYKGCLKDCHYTEAGCRVQLLKDALELLKEQQKTIERLEYDLAVTTNNLNYYVNGND